MPSLVQYDDTQFRLLFPAFANPLTYPPATIQLYWNRAGNYINPVTGSCWWVGMNPGQQVEAMNDMTAHLLQLGTLAATGEEGGVITAATIDKISVTLQAPPSPNQWQWWLNQTPYGKMLLALLQIAAVGGRYYVGGTPPLLGFRR